MTLPMSRESWLTVDSDGSGAFLRGGQSRAGGKGGEGVGDNVPLSQTHFRSAWSTMTPVFKDRNVQSGAFLPQCWYSMCYRVPLLL
ncbi:hypothetical protein BaRGS_00015828 [Batillaria attramentaria]|uniref:Uncharacterized protein n=1 Tax=Batillaria attramentaria TaxID=370345 RepID=A0ABD0L041_9CAEN